MRNEGAFQLLKLKLEENAIKVKEARKKLGISVRDFKSTQSLLEETPSGIPSTEEMELENAVIKELCNDLKIRWRWRETVRTYLFFGELTDQEEFRLEDLTNLPIVTIRSNRAEMVKAYGKKKQEVEEDWGVPEHKKGSKHLKEYLRVWELHKEGLSSQEIADKMGYGWYDKVHEALRYVRRWIKDHPV